MVNARFKLTSSSGKSRKLSNKQNTHQKFKKTTTTTQEKV